VWSYSPNFFTNPLAIASSSSISSFSLFSISILISLSLFSLGLKLGLSLYDEKFEIVGLKPSLFILNFD